VRAYHRTDDGYDSADRRGLQPIELRINGQLRLLPVRGLTYIGPTMVRTDGRTGNTNCHRSAERDLCNLANSSPLEPDCCEVHR